MTTNTNGDLPLLSTDLIEELDKIYPERSPDRDQSFVDIMFEAGQRNVVRNLKIRLRQAQEEDLLTQQLQLQEGE
jgi:hypothetical protein